MRVAAALLAVTFIAGCAQPPAAEIVAACAEVRELERAVLDLAEADASDLDELGVRVGALLRQGRDVLDAAETTDNTVLRDQARLLTEEVLPSLAAQAPFTEDARLLASPPARVTVAMLEECERLGALD